MRHRSLKQEVTELTVSTFFILCAEKIISETMWLHWFSPFVQVASFRSLGVIKRLASVLVVTKFGTVLSSFYDGMTRNDVCVIFGRVPSYCWRKFTIAVSSWAGI